MEKDLVGKRIGYRTLRGVLYGTVVSEGFEKIHVRVYLNGKWNDASVDRKDIVKVCKIECKAGCNIEFQNYSEKSKHYKDVHGSVDVI